MLGGPIEGRPFLSQTDTSGVGIGAVLSQEMDDGMGKPITYYLRDEVHRPRSKNAWQ